MARDIGELETEMKRLADQDPGCVTWHLESGHISRWLVFIGEKRLAASLDRAENLENAIKAVARTNSRRKAAGNAKSVTQKAGKPAR